MDYLRLPHKRPSYRGDRPHTSFLGRLKDHAKSREVLIEQLKQALVKRFYIQPFDMQSRITQKHRQTTRLIEVSAERGL